MTWSIAFLKPINWRKVISGALAAGAAAAATAAAHAVAPALAPYVPAGVLAGLLHYVDAWGSEVQQDKPSA